MQLTSYIEENQLEQQANFDSKYFRYLDSDSKYFRFYGTRDKIEDTMQEAGRILEGQTSSALE